MFAFLPLISSLASFHCTDKTFSFRYRSRPSCLPWLACLTYLPWLPYPTHQNVFIKVQKETIMLSLACLPYFPTLAPLPYRPKTFSFKYRKRQSCLPWLACLPFLAWMLGSLQTKNVFIQVQKEKSANDCLTCQHRLPRHQHSTKTKMFSF